MRTIENTKFYSQKIGLLPKGCQMCVKGEKLVIYITGICPRKCFYCPLSEKRKDKDVIYINEWKTNKIEDAIKEAKISSAKGCSFTGGDPLAKLDRTLEYIKALKKEFGKKFHIHLYTSLILLNEQTLQKLYEAGLDEIRFHPDFEKKEEWKKINLANKFDWDIGVEIPAIPEYEKQILELVDFCEGKIKAMTVNEFEMADLNADALMKKGYDLKEDIYHGVIGTDELMTKILQKSLDKSFNVHACSSTLKDRVQMQNRFKLRAKNIKTKFDIITDEGLLIRGIIEVGDKNLEESAKFLKEEGLEIFIDEKKNRLITYPEHVEQFADILKDLGLIPSIIEEDPTVEAFIVNRDYL
ncbi:MAG: radical SAM protein [Minisyncoccales bacterium]